MGPVDRARLVAFGLALALAQAASARTPGDSVFIAGDGFSIEQAVADSAAQRTAGDPPGKIIVLGAAVKRLAKEGAGYSVRDALAAARKGGVTLYVCAKDMRAARLASKDFLSGVRVVRGWTEAPAQAQVEQFRMAPDRRMRSLCAE